MPAPLPPALAAAKKEEQARRFGPSASGAILEAKASARGAGLRPPAPPGVNVPFRLRERRRPNLAYEATHRAHHYSPEEQKKFAQYQSISYLPLHTKIYREWLRNNWNHSVWEHWIMMGIIGISTGLLGALIKNIVQYFVKLKFMHVNDFLENHNLGVCWMYFVSISCLLAFFAAAIVVYFEPTAGGSGVPEIIAYLNGVSIPRVRR